jgi:glutathione S-transferase
LNLELDGKDHLTGKQFTAADAYLFMTVNWRQRTGIDLARWPVLANDVKRVAARPKVREALPAEGLVQ